MKYPLLIASTMLLSGCILSGNDFKVPEKPMAWTAYHSDLITSDIDIKSLKNWWKRFDDPVLDQLINMTLMDSPDRLIAETRIQEARGIKRTARSFLFPQVGIKGSGGRQDNGIGTDDFYDAGFDASFELDIFGRNRKANQAADAQIQALEASYHNTSLTLISEVARTYISVRSAEKQVAIAKKNLDIQQKTLELIKQQKEIGEAPQLDVERSETLVNQTKASIPEFQRLADNARLQLTVLTGRMPVDIAEILSMPAKIPGANVEPVLLAPVDVLALRPDIQAATATLVANTKLAEAATAELFPSFTLSGFFGVAEGVMFDNTSIWDVTLNTAFALLDFGRIEGAIDTARALEARAYQQYRKTILEAITEVETALSDYARINEQRVSLQKAFKNADNALTLSQTLFREGEISFLDVLDAQRTVNETDSALVNAEAAQAESLIRLYKSLGAY